MKLSQSVMHLVAIVALAFFLNSCASTTPQKATQIGASITAFRTDVINIKRATDATLTALNSIVETADNDPKKSFNSFAGSLERLDRAVLTAKARAQEIKFQGEAFFKQWETEFKNLQDPELRKLAETRKAKLQEIFTRITPLVQQIQADFDPFASDVHDLAKYLSNDLTLGGIDASRKLMIKTIAHGRAVQTGLEELIVELNSIAATITPSKPK